MHTGYESVYKCSLTRLAWRASARSLSQELKNLRIMQQTQCAALERRIEEYYQQAYIQSELIAIQG